MISGVITPSREAVVNLILYTLAGTELEIGFVVDTGFNSSLTLPPDLIEGLDNRFVGVSEVTLADGSVCEIRIFKCIVSWMDKRLAATVFEMKAQPLLGMAMLYGNEIRMPVLDGAQFTVTPLPNI